jgi:hypothetical protein
LRNISLGGDLNRSSDCRLDEALGHNHEAGARNFFASFHGAPHAEAAFLHGHSAVHLDR